MSNSRLITTFKTCHSGRSAQRGPQRAFFARWGGERAVEEPRQSQSRRSLPKASAAKARPSTTNPLHRRHPERSIGHHRYLPLTAFAFALTFSLLGCKPTPPPTPTPKTQQTQQAPAPTRPTTAPPAFKLFHQTKDSFTLVTTPTATDDQISAIIWQLRDAAHTRTLDTLHIPQKVVDARDPMVWFHIYRGSKCASEKYTTGKLPCGASYHAAGDYTFGGGADNQWDDGVLIHDESHQTELWPAGSPYSASLTTNH